MRKILVALLFLLLPLFLIGTSCKPRTPSDVSGSEAGPPPTGSGLCTRLEGLTENKTIIAICATVEEIAYVVSILGPLLSASGDAGDAGTCSVVPTTTVCATPLQMGRGIRALLEKRRGLLLLDAGRDGSR